MNRRALILAFMMAALSARTGWAEAARTTLFGTTRPEVARALDLGPVAGDMPMENVLLLLRRPAQSEATAEAFVDALHDPASPSFHHWLSSAEIASRFGPAPADIAALVTWLRGQGLQVNRVLPGNMVIDISGAAAAIGRAFGTSIHTIVVDGTRHIANVTDISIPAALAPVLAGPLSLHDFRPHNRHLAAPRLTNGAGGELVTPGDIATIYNFNPLHAHGLAGKGQTIAVVEDTDLYADADWTTFRSVFNLARFKFGSLATRHPGCRDPGVNPNGDDVEAALDVEWSSAAAPEAAIVLASCRQTATTDGVTLAMTNLISGGSPPKIISVSYGECETLNTPPGNKYYSTLFQQAVMQGISVFVATGDAGPSDCSNFTNGTAYGIGVSGWASTPNDIAVGGTDFADKYFGREDIYWRGSNGAGEANAKSYIPEQGWNDTCAGRLFTAREGFATSYGANGFCNAAAGKYYRELGGGEGGPSSCATGTAPPNGVVGGTCKGWPKPRWQTGVIGIPADGVRDIPDVSLFASDGWIWKRQYAICFSDPNNYGVPCVGTTPAQVDQWAPGGGGTSYAAPIIAGLQALINEKTGSAWGNANYVLYRLAAREYGVAGNNFCDSTRGNRIAPSCFFNDVRIGDDDQDCIHGSADCFSPSGHLGVLSTSTTAYRPSFVLTKGYDFPSGIGTINAKNLVDVWPMP